MGASDLRLLAVDPGRTTGVAGGVVRLRSDSLARDVLVAAHEEGRLWTDEISGTATEQAAEIVALVARSRSTLLVIEDFALRSRNADLAPVEILSALDALRARDGLPAAERQMPSAAKSYLTNERMRDWGLWVVGSPHERDALRHLALAVSRKISCP